VQMELGTWGTGKARSFPLRNLLLPGAGGSHR
jgi:hypothetical protein